MFTGGISWRAPANGTVSGNRLPAGSPKPKYSAFAIALRSITLLTAARNRWSSKGALASLKARISVPVLVSLTSSTSSAFCSASALRGVSGAVNSPPITSTSPARSAERRVCASGITSSSSRECAGLAPQYRSLRLKDDPLRSDWSSTHGPVPTGVEYRPCASTDFGLSIRTGRM